MARWTTPVRLPRACRFVTRSPRCPRVQREAVVLRYLADLPIADVARAMDCATGTVKATLHQAMRSMRVELDDTEGDDADR